MLDILARTRKLYGYKIYRVLTGGIEIGFAIYQTLEAFGNPRSFKPRNIGRQEEYM